MNQVGQLKNFVVQGTPPSGSYAYVFKFPWDSSVIVSGSGSVAKTLNLGGNPSDSFLLRFNCEICDQLGNSQVLNGSIACNNPPTVVQAPTVSNNNQTFPYQSTITVLSYDLEQTGALVYDWYSGTNPLPSGVTTNAGLVAGMYAGTYVGMLTAYQNVMTTTVSAAEVLTCQVVDANSGTTALNFRLDGFNPAAPQFSLAAQPSGLTTTPTTPPTAVISSTPVLLTAYASDAHSGSLVFNWSFYGSNGWQASNMPYFSAGTNTAVPGGYRGDLLYNVGGESTAGLRTVNVGVTNLTTGVTAQSQIQVSLIVDRPPTITGIGVFDAVTGLPLPTPYSRASTGTIRFTATATDPQAETLYFVWSIVGQPVTPMNTTLYGHDVLLNVSGYPVGNYALGSVVAIDVYGTSSPSFLIPPIVSS